MEKETCKTCKFLVKDEKRVGRVLIAGYCNIKMPPVITHSFATNSMAAKTVASDYRCDFHKIKGEKQ